jgi:hypothetical protein
MKSRNKISLVMSELVLSALLIATSGILAASQGSLAFQYFPLLTVGPQKIETAYLHAIGTWSDDTAPVGFSSTEIDCFSSSSICEAATAVVAVGVQVQMFEVLRWNTREIIAEEPRGYCGADILRIDLVKKTVTVSPIAKGKRPCGPGLEHSSPAVLQDGWRIRRPAK